MRAQPIAERSQNGTTLVLLHRIVPAIDRRLGASPAVATQRSINVQHHHHRSHRDARVERAVRRGRTESGPRNRLCSWAFDTGTYDASLPALIGIVDLLRALDCETIDELVWIRERVSDSYLQKVPDDAAEDGYRPVSYVLPLTGCIACAYEQFRGSLKRVALDFVSCEPDIAVEDRGTTCDVFLRHWRDVLVMIETIDEKMA